ncbi:MAG: T9SS type A sorting domain-containing protein [Bacteroidia bacterium]
MKHIISFSISLFGIVAMMHAQQFQNILSNPGAHDSTTSAWTITSSGGDGWSILSSEGVDSTPCWIGSFEWCSKEQTIDLLAFGYDANVLDEAPIVLFSEKYKGREAGGTAADHYRLYVELQDSSGNIIRSFDSGDITTTAEWQTVSGTFRKYGPGLRYIKYVHESKDGDSWAGQYGAQIDASHISISNNIIYAGGRTHDFSGWEIGLNGGDGWTVDDNGRFRTSYDTCSKHQLLDLIALGYTAAELDLEPLILFGEFMKGNGNEFSDIHMMKVQLRDANQNVILEYNWKTNAVNEWRWVSYVMDGYGQGLRYIYYEHSGANVQYWEETHGLSIDYSYLEIQYETPWATNIEDPLSGLSISLFPNPAIDHNLLKITNSNLSNVEIMITNLQGQLIQTSLIGDLHTQTYLHPLVFQGLASGIYNVTLTSDEGNKSIRMMVQ